jgi:hypothetical protein
MGMTRFMSVNNGKHRALDQEQQTKLKRCEEERKKSGTLEDGSHEKKMN